eukprot:14551489-Alexandrium_andersonii.AAC.1
MSASLVGSEMCIRDSQAACGHVLAGKGLAAQFHTRPCAMIYQFDARCVCVSGAVPNSRGAR